MTGHDKEQLTFPLTFDLKVIMEPSKDGKRNREKIHNSLAKLKIEHGEFTHRLSSKGSFRSYTVSVTVSTSALFQQLYTELRTLDGVRYIL